MGVEQAGNGADANQSSRLQHGVSKPNHAALCAVTVVPRGRFNQLERDLQCW